MDHREGERDMRSSRKEPWSGSIDERVTRGVRSCFLHLRRQPHFFRAWPAWKRSHSEGIDGEQSLATSSPADER